MTTVGTEPITEYQARAALLVISLLDPDGNTGGSLRDSFVAAATAGLSPAVALRDGLDLLVRLDFVVVEDDFYRRAAALVMLEHTSEPEAMAVLNHAQTSARESEADALREEVGRVAEEHVVRQCVDELTDLGHPSLAANVLQVSLISDRYGYDVSAPAIEAPARQLEVKGSMHVEAGLFRFYLTRHEYTVGRRELSAWSLVACAVQAVATSSQAVPEQVDGRMKAELLGHCSAEVLTPFVPEDANGRWTEALVSLPRHLLRHGLPSALP